MDRYRWFNYFLFFLWIGFLPPKLYAHIGHGDQFHFHDQLVMDGSVDNNGDQGYRLSLNDDEGMVNSSIEGEKTSGPSSNAIESGDSGEVKKGIEGWGNLKLGLGYLEIRAVLSNEYPWLILRPSDDVRTVNENRYDVETSFFLETYKNDFFNKVQFQFNKDKILYLLRLEMSPRYFSFIGLYDKIQKRYGAPQDNSNVRVTWKDGLRSLELFRNNVIQYIDKQHWNEKISGSQAEEKKQQFLNTVFENF